MSHNEHDGEGATLRRRQLLGGAAATTVGAAVGCGSDADVASTNGATSSASTGGAGGGASTSNTVASTSANTTTSGAGGSGGAGPVGCADDGGLSPEELLAPIDTIVVLMLENRSFDHYLGGSLGIVEGRADIAGLSGSESQPAPGGGSVGVYHMTDLQPASPPHTWSEVHEQWNGGACDGFVTSHAGPNQDEVMGYYLRDQVPIHHALADAYAVCNAYHCAVLGPTWPNRFYLHGATSRGMKANQPVVGFQPVWPLLDDVGASHVNYHHGVAWASGGYFKLDGLALFDQFKQDAAAGTLPNFSIIDPQFFGLGANDDHPSNADVPLAQLLISDVYSTLAASPQWSRTLLIVTYDEHGGFYDHVVPPAATDSDADFTSLGFRIPALVAGPYVRGGCAIDTVFQHASVLRTLMTRFGIPSLNARMAGANDFSSCIDPSRVKNQAPAAPVSLPTVDISSSVLRSHVTRAPQHAEILDALRQQGLERAVLRGVDHHAMFERHLEDCVRRGLARLVG